MQRSCMYNLKLWCFFMTMSWGECLGCAGFTRCKPSFPTRAGGTQRGTVRKNAWQEPRDLKEHIPWYSLIFVQPWESHWPGMPRVASRRGRCSGKSSAMECTGCKHEVEHGLNTRFVVAAVANVATFVSFGHYRSEAVVEEMHQQEDALQKARDDDWLSSLSLESKAITMFIPLKHASTDSRILYTWLYYIIHACAWYLYITEILSSNLRSLQFSGLLILLMQVESRNAELRSEAGLTILTQPLEVMQVLHLEFWAVPSCSCIAGWSLQTLALKEAASEKGSELQQSKWASVSAEPVEGTDLPRTKIRWWVATLLLYGLLRWHAG